MHMSHKKRASTAFKSIGAAGLAAATIVSGLSFGPAGAASASASANSIAAETPESLGKVPFYFQYGSGFAALSGGSGNPTTGFMGNLQSYSTAAAAEAGAPRVTVYKFTDGGLTFKNDANKCVFMTEHDNDAWGKGIGVATQNPSSSPCTLDKGIFRISEAGQLTNVRYGQSIGTLRSGSLGAVGQRMMMLGGTGFEFPAVDKIVDESEKKSLVAQVTRVNNIAKSAVLSGTATPGAKVSIGNQEVEADKTSGAWSITVPNLTVGANELTVIQKVGGTEHDRKTVTATIVEGGTLVGVDQGPIDLERGVSTKVPFVVENRELRSGTKGSVTLDAPEGTTFDGQTTVQGSWRVVGGTNWSSSASIPLTDGRLSNDDKTITFEVDWSSDRPVNQQYRFMMDVTADDAAPAGSGAMEFTMPGTSSKGDFKAEGKTTTTIETAEVALDAKVESIDHAAKTAVISGTATPGATVSIGEQSVEADAETGAWSVTVRDLDEGANELTVTQKVGDRTIDDKDLTVTINSAAISGQDGAPVTLERDGDTSVEALFKTNGSISRPQGTVEFTAPEGTTFAAGQNTISGSYKVPGDDWKNTAMTLSNGVRSEDGTKYTYDFRTTTSTWNLPADSLMRWNIKVNTPATAEPSTGSMTTAFTGTAVEGSFNTTSTTATTIEGNRELAPITLTGPASVTPGVANTFTGTAEPGATFRVLNASGTQIVPGTHEVDENGNWTFNRIVSNGAANFRFVIEQTKNGQAVTSELFTIDATALAPVTVATPDRVTPGVVNTFTGTGEPDATYRVLNISGTQIVPGTLQINAQGNWTFNRIVSNGAPNFRFIIEQTKNGQTEKSELFTINAADLAPVTVANRSVTPGVVNTFTGTGEPRATYRVLNISGTQIVPGSFEVDPQGNWTFDRAVSRGATEFRFALEQTKNGKTELSELFTLAADTK